MKKVLGLDLGTNSIGWALTTQDFENKKGEINGLGSRIIPMSQEILGKFDSGQSHSQTAERTSYRGVRRLIQRNLLRRERLHRVLNVLKFLPEHYSIAIDFEKHFGQFKDDQEVKLNYRKNISGKHEFLFMDSFQEMVNEFKENKQDVKIPLDWTLYYLRKKALTKKISKQELAWILLNFNQKRGYYQLRGEEEEESVAYNKVLGKNPFSLMINLFGHLLDQVERNDILIGKLAAKNKDVKLNLYYTPSKLTENSLIFNKKLMTSWWQQGYYYAKNKCEQASSNELRID